MGAVWLAGDELLHKEVAVKEIPWARQLSAARQESRRERAFREARAVAGLDHPNIAGIYDIVQDDGRLWMVMRLAPFRFPYRSLSDVVQDDGPLPPVWAARIGLQILSAIHAAHGVGALHRDINPGNVLLGPADRVLLSGFGMVTADGSPALTTPGAFTGSPAYMAPERARGGPATPSADLWSLGATLYAAVEGRPPFHRDGKVGVLTAVIGDYVDPPSHAGPLWPLISALLCKDPSVRPDAAETERLLQRVAGSRRGAQSAPLAAEAARPAAGDGPAPGSDQRHRPNGASSNSAASNPSQKQPAEAGSAGSEPGFVPGFGPRDDLPASQTPAPGHRTQEEPLPDRRRQWWQLIAAAAVTVILTAIIAAIDLAPKGTTSHQIAVPGQRSASPGYPAAMPGHQRLSPAPEAPPARPAQRPRPAGLGPSGPNSPAPGGSGLGVLPRGFSWYHDPTGFSLGRLGNWRISHRGTWSTYKTPTAASS
jgi:serine/threonine protein kinase